ncbi:HNH endonuclease [Singulisphaera sp. GP187]|uniref:HNH endonuclease n=1 Tax=Singulisphaera sp. GP187 TaxID=1882752 RepID=UPI000926665C|nr:HNH endonuclease signature motif containing protein [Singulisphaera sp. GP187]SIO13880.1 HNH endonuclease [Singulisphaera sp. GP187]
MDAALTRLIWQRAMDCCEYCQMPQVADDASFEIDHVIARKHGGPTATNNSCLSCYYCNSFKGSDIGSLDPKTRKLTPLFNTRRHKWARHFLWQGAYLLGRTPVGRVTVALLRINDEYRVELRDGLIEEGAFPPR